jgi:hypothetical protein
MFLMIVMTMHFICTTDTDMPLSRHDRNLCANMRRRPPLWLVLYAVVTPHALHPGHGI